MIDALLQDVRYALRTMRRKPGFTTIVVLALAIGIGANTAIFSVVNAVLLQALPYKDPNRLVMIWETNPTLQVGYDLLPASTANFVNWRDQSKSFESVSIIDNARVTLTGLGTPERVAGANVSSSFFDVMGVEPVVGRIFSREEDKPGSNHVAVISYAMWQRRFGGEQDVLGKTLVLDSASYIVIGVMPEGFQFPRAQDLPTYFQLAPQTELWLPVGLTNEQIQNRGSHNKAVIARLRPEVTIQQARADLTTIASNLAEQYPDNSGWGVAIVSLQDQLVGDMRSALWVLLGAVGFVLIIACANVANLLLAKSAARQKEIAIRTALGGSRSRVVRQLLTESMLLSLMGGFAGILLAILGINLFLAWSPANIPRKHEIGIDASVLGFTFAISLLTGLLFGLAPAIQTSKPNLNEALKDGLRGSTTGLSNNLRGLLIISEIALSLVLLIGAGLTLKSFARLLKIDPGFNAPRTLTMSIALPDYKYPELRQQVSFFKQALEQVAALPGVDSVGAVSELPLSGAEEVDQFTIEGRPVPANKSDTPLADFRFVDQNYFSTMGISLSKGRYFTEHDTETAPPIVIISESLARRFFPGEDAVGKRMRAGDADSHGPWATVAGVVRDVKHSALDAESRPQLYFPYTQKLWGHMTIVTRSTTDPKFLANSMRDTIWAIDKDQPVTDMKTLEQYIDDSVSKKRFSMVLLTSFAVVALILAAVGIYGVMSYLVSQRKSEMGIRLALGAQPWDIMRLILGQGLKLISIGVTVGLAAAIALTRLLSSLLFGVSATDPVTFAFISLSLIAIALLASYVPARRATKVDPMIALRNE